MGEQARLPLEFFSAKSSFVSELALKFGVHSVNQIAAHADSANELDRSAAVARQWRLTRVLAFLANGIICGNEDGLAERYQGSSWCDSTEYDLNRDVATGQRTRR